MKFFTLLVKNLRKIFILLKHVRIKILSVLKVKKMGLVEVSIPDEVVEVYPYLGDRRGRFRLSDLVESTGMPASTCHKILRRMTNYNMITKQSTRSRIWIKKYDTVSKWMQNYLLLEVRDLEKKGGLKVKKMMEREERPL